MNIELTVVGGNELEIRLSEAPALYLDVIERKMNILIDLIFKRVGEKLDGEVLQRRTGKLFGSIQSDITREGDDHVIGRVFTNNPIASVHEHGATTRPHEIVPVTARALRFSLGKIFFIRDDIKFAAHVNHPGSKIPARSFMASSLAECIPIIRQIFAGRIPGIV